ncbi:hypothetical protein BJX70DRAFT_338776 [Aspergillus crustosus]
MLTTKLMTWSPIFPAPQAQTLLTLHTLAFYHAIQVFHLMHLLLPLSHLDPASIFNIQTQIHTQIRCALIILLEIEHLKSSTPGLSITLTAPIIWPGFIASCAASPEERTNCKQWWNMMLGYRIGKVRGLWRTVQEV